jgi:hypothetical protein
MVILGLIPVVLAGVALAGSGVLALMGEQVMVRPMVAAGSAVFFGSMLAMAPAGLMSRSPARTVVQAAVGGMAVQFFLVAMFGGLGWLSQMSGATTPYLSWLAIYYVAVVVTVGIWTMGRVRTLRNGGAA